MKRTEKFFRVAEALPLVALAIYAVATEPLSLFLFALSATALHELGHLAALSLFCPEGVGIRVVAFGLRITPRGGRLISHGREAIAALAGPAANTLAAAIALALSGASGASAPLVCFASVNLILAALNLIPISSFDGGRVLLSLLSCAVSQDRAVLAVSAVSTVCASLGVFVGLYLLLSGGGGLYLFSVSFSLLLRELFSVDVRT